MKRKKQQIVSNYRSVFFLLICSKIYKKIIFDIAYELLDRNFLLENNSYTHQLIAIAHNIFAAFDANPSLEVCSIFLDLS